MGDLNAKVGLGNSGVEYVVGRHGLSVRNDNGGRFVDFCSTHHFGGTTFQHRTRDNVSWRHHSGRYANQIDQLSIWRRFRSCLKVTGRWPILEILGIIT